MALSVAIINVVPQVHEFKRMYDNVVSQRKGSFDSRVYLYRLCATSGDISGTTGC